MSAQRHTFVLTFEDGTQLMVEEYVDDAVGERRVYVATREKGWHTWGPPRSTVQTS